MLIQLFCAVLCTLSIAAETNLERTPRFFTHILDYIAVDYSGAVEKGKVINADEYKEQIEFSNTVLELAKELPELKEAAEIQNELLLLNQKILKKADSGEVSALARKISNRAVSLCKIQNVPSRWPNLHRGKRLYDQSCSGCHGLNGHGDGPSGKDLDPKPADFHADKMENLPPFQLFNAIRLGVPGTAMASFNNFSDRETWDLAFFVSSLRHGSDTFFQLTSVGEDLKHLDGVATKSDRVLREEMPGVGNEKQKRLSLLRLHSADATEDLSSISLAEEQLEKALTAFTEGNYDSAKTSAIIAYLDGIEPVEPRLRARDFGFTQVLEADFGAVRSAIDSRASVETVQAKINKALGSCLRARQLLEQVQGSPTVTFSVAAGIFIREGFEAALILITLLGIVRSVGVPHAAISIHFGWISATVFGILTWFFSGWILHLSGARREILEGVISGIAVIVLLYFGFWLHRKTEIGRWRVFIQEMTKKAVSKKSLFALGSVAFMGVFRECFETVLFLRALLIEAGPGQNWALALGVLSSFLLVLVCSIALIRQSAKIPIRQLFRISSCILVFLALILVGKMMHSFQETGLVGVTPISLPFSFEVLGLFPTLETFVSQIVLLSAIILIVLLTQQISSKKGSVAESR